MNVNDISGFDAMTEEVRQVYAERDRLRDENEAFRQFKKDICEVLGIGGNSHNDGVVKLLKANKARTSMETDDLVMYRGILDEIKTIFDMSSAWTYGEIPFFVKSVYKTNIKRQEEFTEEAASILGVHPGDLSLSDILEALRKLKREEKLDEMNCEIIANLREERDKETSRRIKAEEYACDASKNFEKICSALGIEYDIDTTIEYVLDTIDDLRSKEGTYCHQSFVFRSVCDYLGIAADDATLSDIRKEIEKLKSWKTVAADHDRRRKNWVRKYQSEHKRANSCDALYKKYKALYDADAPAREKLSDDLHTYRVSYEAVKNDATKNRSLMNTVAQIVGTVGMHDDVTMAGVLNAKKKANHWDVLVDGYGEGTMRSLLDNIGIDVSGDKGNGLFG